MSKLVLAQIRIDPGEPGINHRRALDAVAKAADLGAALVLLPEAMPVGWTDPSAREHAETLEGGPYIDGLRAAAARHRVHLCSGWVERSAGLIFNSAILLNPAGDVILRHRKIHELDLAHDLYALGDRLGVADTALGRIGLMICADGFAPGQVLARSLGHMGAELILSPCAWAVPSDFDQSRTPYGGIWWENHGAVCRDFQLHIAAASNVGPITAGPWAGRLCIGNSLVIGPSGKPVAKGGFGIDAEELIEFEWTPPPRPARGTLWGDLWRAQSSGHSQ